LDPAEYHAWVRPAVYTALEIRHGLAGGGAWYWLPSDYKTE
jgi:hypothetical protein